MTSEAIFVHITFRKTTYRSSSAIQAINYFGANPTRQQFTVLAKVPFSEKILQQHKDTHILVAVLPLSILEVREKVQSKRLFYKQRWYNNQPFAKDKGEVCWQLIRKTPVDGSTSKSWGEQQMLLSKDEEVPTAQVMVYTIIGHFLATGERLFDRIYVRTCSAASYGRRVHVGGVGLTDLGVYGYWGVFFSGRLGVASVRKFD